MPLFPHLDPSTYLVPVELRDRLLSPSTIVWLDRVRRNVARIVEALDGDPSRWRPHVKTTKLPAVWRELVGAGVSHFKCATTREARHLLLTLEEAGVEGDVLLSHPLVGPNLGALGKLASSFPRSQVSVLVEDPELAQQVPSHLGLFVDVNPGMDRTGIPASRSHQILEVARAAGTRLRGLHYYDGHHHQSDPDERTAAIQAAWQPVESLIHRLESADLPVPELLCGGTPSFPVYAKFENPRIRLSPGTCTLHDVGYGRKCPDLVFDVAAAVATRVVSNAVPGQLTLDVGHKAIAADPPADFRAVLPDLPDAEAIIHNEEHLTVTTEHAVKYAPGDLLFAFPVHICPTVALHESAIVIKDEVETDRWMIARHRILRDV